MKTSVCYLAAGGGVSLASGVASDFSVFALEYLAFTCLVSLVVSVLATLVAFAGSTALGGKTTFDGQLIIFPMVRVGRRLRIAVRGQQQPVPFRGISACERLLSISLSTSRTGQIVLSRVMLNMAHQGCRGATAGRRLRQR